MRRRIELVVWLATMSCAGAAVLAVGAQAADRPDDRAGTIGVGGAAAPMPSDVVDRAVARHGSATLAAVRLSTPSDVVDRAIARHGSTRLYAADVSTPLRPDDRAGIRGAALTVRSEPSTTVGLEQTDGFAWGYAAGGAALLGLVLMVGGIATIGARHRRVLAR